MAECLSSCPCANQQHPSLFDVCECSIQASFDAIDICVVSLQYIPNILILFTLNECIDHSTFPSQLVIQQHSFCVMLLVWDCYRCSVEIGSEYLRDRRWLLVM